MWFITLLVLAVAAVLIIKAVKAHSERQAPDIDDQPLPSGLQGSLPRSDSASGMQSTADSANPGQEASAPEPSANGTTVEPAEHESSLTSGSASTHEEIREMIKILNLTDSDSPRLGISSDEFNALRNADSSTSGLPDSSAQADVAERLRRMLN